jgi:hypothetical protein
LLFRALDALKAALRQECVSFRRPGTRPHPNYNVCMSTGRNGYTGANHIGPTGIYDALASATTAGTAVTYVNLPTAGEPWRSEPGFHPEQAAPYTYVSLPHFDVQHHVSTLEYVTLDGGMIGAPAVVASIAAGRKLHEFATNDEKLRAALARIEQRNESSGESSES